MLNKVILIGRLVADPEVKYFQGESAVANFTLAVDRSYKNKDGNREADFIPCVTWNKTAELCERYLNKGSQIAVVGSIQTRNYTAQDGSKRYVTEVKADEVKFLGSNKKTAEKRADEPTANLMNDNPMDGFDEIDLDLPF